MSTREIVGHFAEERGEARQPFVATARQIFCGQGVGDFLERSAAVPAIEIEFPGDARVRIPTSVSPALAAAVVPALLTHEIQQD